MLYRHFTRNVTPLLPVHRRFVQVFVMTAILSGIAAPNVAGAWLPRMDESQSTSETEQECPERFEEGLACNRRQLRLPAAPRAWCRATSTAIHLPRRLVANSWRALVGHRLASGIVAPLTC